MDENKSAGNRQEPIRDDLRQKDEGGKDSTRIGSTYDDVTAKEWKPGDGAHHRTENPEAIDGGIQTGTGGNGGDLADG
jgi:hypothetical protein